MAAPTHTDHQRRPAQRPGRRLRRSRTECRPRHQRRRHRRLPVRELLPGQQRRRDRADRPVERRMGSRRVGRWASLARSHRRVDEPRPRLDRHSRSTTTAPTGATRPATFGVGDLGTPGAANTTARITASPTIVFIHDVQGSGPAVAITGPVTCRASSPACSSATTRSTRSSSRKRTPTPMPIRQPRRASSCSAEQLPDVVATGDLVTVTGDAEEFFGMSQIDIAFGSGTAVHRELREPASDCRRRSTSLQRPARWQRGPSRTSRACWSRSPTRW